MDILDIHSVESYGIWIFIIEKHSKTLKAEYSVDETIPEIVGKSYNVVWHANGGLSITQEGIISTCDSMQGIVEATILFDDCSEYGSNIIIIDVKTPFKLNKKYLFFNLDEIVTDQLIVTEWDDSVSDRNIRWRVESGVGVVDITQDGVVTANGPGYATIVAETNERYSARCSVFVNQYAHEMSFQTVYLQPGEERNIQDYVRFEPEETNIYSLGAVEESNDVSSYSYGIVRGISEGEGSLTLQEYYSGLSAECNIVVCQHEMVESYIYIAPTCFEGEFQETAHCTKCGYVEGYAIGEPQHNAVCIRSIPAGNGEDGEICAFCRNCHQTLQVIRFIESNSVLEFPQNLTVIGEEAFLGTSAQQIVLGSNVQTIGPKAFCNCNNLLVIIPESVTSIADDAFENCSGMVILCNENSVAHSYAINHGYTASIIEQDCCTITN